MIVAISTDDSLPRWLLCGFAVLLDGQARLGMESMTVRGPRDGDDKGRGSRLVAEVGVTAMWLSNFDTLV